MSMCNGTVWPTGSFRPQRCTHKGSIEEHGAHWCRVHAPSIVAEKAKKREDEYRAGWTERDRVQRISKSYKDAQRALADAAVDLLRQRIGFTALEEAASIYESAKAAYEKEHGDK